MSRFDTTRWSMVLQARGDDRAAREALESLCRTYRPPVLAYIRSRGLRDDAEDLTQAFFTRFLEREDHAAADPARGRFRAFLLTAVRHFMINAAAEALALKRGGQVRFESFDLRDADGVELTDDSPTPERVFEKAWAVAVLDGALRRLRDEARAAGKVALFDKLRELLTQVADDAGHARVAAELNLRRNTVTVSVHRLRQRLRELVREEVAQTAADEHELKRELRELRDALGEAMH